MHESQFQQLWQLYLSDKISPMELEQLMAEIKMGSLDNEVKTEISNLLSNEKEALRMPLEKANRLLHKILDAEEQNARLLPIRTQKIPYWKPLLAIAAAVFLVLIGVWVTRDSTMYLHGEANKGKATNTVAPVISKHKFVRLSDGTSVLLNDGSELHYETSFTGSKREVSLIGEAYFDVTHDPDRPFIVTAGKLKITVLGTAFNVKAVGEQADIVVTVTRGKVKVAKDATVLGIITANEQLAFNASNDSFQETTINAEAALKWKKNYLVLDNSSLEEAAAMISNKYNVDILFANDSIKKCQISATFLDNESLDQVLSVITTVLNLEFSKQPNDQVILKGTGCN